MGSRPIELADVDLAIEARRKEIEPKRKYWRVYFTCKDFFPHLGAIDNGRIDSQIHVQWIAVRGTTLRSATDMGHSKDEYIRVEPLSSIDAPQCKVADRKGKQNEPIWWLETEAIAVFRDGGVELIGDTDY